MNRSVLRSIIAIRMGLLAQTNGLRLQKFSCYSSLQKSDKNNGSNGLFSHQPQQITTKHQQPSDFEKSYEKVANETLESLSDRFDRMSDELMDLLSDDYDATFSNGVLTLKLGADLGTYVINKQTPNLQIWLSSPTSGPKRFDFIDGTWVYKRTGETLHGLLAAELSKCFDKKIDLSMCSFSPKQKI